MKINVLLCIKKKSNYVFLPSLLSPYLPLLNFFFKIQGEQGPALIQQGGGRHPHRPPPHVYTSAWKSWKGVYKSTLYQYPLPHTADPQLLCTVLCFYVFYVSRFRYSQNSQSAWVGNLDEEGGGEGGAFPRIFRWKRDRKKALKKARRKKG